MGNYTRKVLTCMILALVFSSNLSGTIHIGYEIEENSDNIKHFLLNDTTFFPIGWYGGPQYHNNYMNHTYEDSAYDPVDYSDGITGDNDFKNVLDSIKASGANIVMIYDQNSIEGDPTCKRLSQLRGSYLNYSGCSPTGIKRMMKIINNSELYAIVDIHFHIVRKNYWRSWAGNDTTYTSSAIYYKNWITNKEYQYFYLDWGNLYSYITDYNGSVESQTLFNNIFTAGPDIGETAYSTIIPPSHDETDRLDALGVYLNSLSSNDKIFAWGTYDEPEDLVGYSWVSDNAKFTWNAIKHRMKIVNEEIENYYTSPSTNYIPSLPVFRFKPYLLDDNIDPLKYYYESLRDSVCKYSAIDYYPVWDSVDKTSILIPQHVIPGIEINKKFSNAGPVIWVAQGHGHAGLAEPSEKNLRYQTYAPIIHGARGIMYYNYYQNTAATKERVHTLIAEITGNYTSYYNNSNSIDLTEVIINGTTPSDSNFIKVQNNSTDNPDTSIIHYLREASSYTGFENIDFKDINLLVKEYKGYYYLFICNDSPNSKTVRLFSRGIPFGIIKEITKNGFSAEKRISSRFFVQLDDFEAKVFQIEKLDKSDTDDIVCLYNQDNYSHYQKTILMRPYDGVLLSQDSNSVDYTDDPKSEYWVYWNGTENNNILFDEDVEYAINGDFDSDGYDDIINFADNKFYYLLNGGGSYFRNYSSKYISNTSSIEINETMPTFYGTKNMLSGNFDDDTLDEVIIIDNNQSDDGLRLLLFEIEDFSYNIASTISIGNNYYYYKSGSGDFNGDGIDDIVILYDQSGTQTIEVLLGNNSGSFSSDVDFTRTIDNDTLIFTNIVYFDTGDMNNDGKDDIVLMYDQNNLDDFQKVLVFLSNGKSFPVFGKTGHLLINSCWHWRYNYQFTYNGVTFMRTGDFNDDGNDDLILSYSQNTDNQKFIVFETDSSGSGFALGNNFDPKLQYWGNFHKYNTYRLDYQKFILSGKFINNGTSLRKSLKEGNPEIDMKHSFRLFQNYPNPFNPSTTISYEIPEASKVEINIYNINGQLIKVLISEYQRPGKYSLSWDASDIPSGLYIYKLQAGDNIAIGKCMLIK